jgi:hypothetical protein
LGHATDPASPRSRGHYPRNVAALARVCIAQAVAKLENRGDENRILKNRWPEDSIAPLILRAASSPATITNTPALAATIVADVIATLGPQSAGARLLQAGLQLTFDRFATVNVPALLAQSTLAAFVGETAPIAVHNLATKASALVPRKIATGVVLTREMVESSNSEALVTDALLRSVGFALDAALFDSTAGDAIRPAGLRAGIAALPASTLTVPDDAMIADLTNTGGAVAALGGDPIFVVALASAITIKLRARREFPYTVLGSPALAAGDVIAIAPIGLASAVAAMPQIETAKAGTLHMEDSAPLQIASGSPGTVAAPTRSLWQTDCVVITISFDVDWCLRDARAVASTTTSAW